MVFRISGQFSLNVTPSNKTFAFFNFLSNYLKQIYSKLDELRNKSKNQELIDKFIDLGMQVNKNILNNDQTPENETEVLKNDYIRTLNQLIELSNKEINSTESINTSPIIPPDNINNNNIIKSSIQISDKTPDTNNKSVKIKDNSSNINTDIFENFLVTLVNELIESRDNLISKSKNQSLLQNFNELITKINKSILYIHKIPETQYNDKKQYFID